MDSNALSRRQVLERAVGVAGLLSGGAVLGEVCQPTPKQQEGPYYPEKDLERDSDLTSIEPGGPKAKGQVIYLTGRVKSGDCRPIEGALVEIWQAAASGKYNHSDDPNDLPLDRNFQYWGRARTDKDGVYRFKTIVPGHYPVAPNQYRPPHIHMKVYAKGHFTLTTQMYFDPKSYDDAKLAAIVDKLNRGERVPKTLTVLFTPSIAGLEAGSKMGSFDIGLQKHGN